MTAYNFLVKQRRVLSLKAFCQNVGISYSNWSKYERGERPVDLTNIIRMHHHYNVTIDFLIHGKEPISGDVALIIQNDEGFDANYGNSVSKNSGDGSITQTLGADSDCQKQLEAVNKENKMLHAQLQDKERIIQLLEAQLKK